MLWILLVLRFDARLTTASASAGTAFFEFLEDVLHARLAFAPTQNP